MMPKFYHLVYDIFDTFAELTHKLLLSNEGKFGYDYLLSRGVTSQQIERYKIGFVPYNNNNAFITRLLVEEHKFNIFDLLRSTLTMINRDLRIIDYFRGPMIIFPIVYQDQIVAFQGRSLSRFRKRYWSMKRPYSLYGLFNIDAIRRNRDKIYITEGIFDSLTMERLGYSSIGILGCNRLTASLAMFFADYPGNVVFIFDNDENGAGFKAAQKSCAELYKVGVKSCYIKRLPKMDDKSTDVNTIFKRVGAKARSIIDDSEEIYVEYEKVVKQNGTKNGKKWNQCAYDIVSVVEHYCPDLERGGANYYRSLCPFSDHEDTEPSFFVYTDSQQFHCFGCGKHGNAISFIMKMHNVGYEQAVRILRGLLSDDK
jgi:DNA primase